MPPGPKTPTNPGARSTPGPVVLGIHWAHDASACIATPDGILATAVEDRLNRKKHYYGFPCEAIRKVLAIAGLTGADIDAVAFTSKKVFYTEHPRYRAIDLDGSVLAERTPGPKDRGWSPEQGVAPKRQKRMEQTQATWGEFAPRHWCFHAEFLHELGLMHPRIEHLYVHHHRCHAASAYRLMGQARACILSVDGKGDGTSACIFRGHDDGRMELLRETPAEHSLGSFYQAVTEGLGFVPVDGEYKTMGLAAVAEPVQELSRMPGPFDDVIRVEDGCFTSSVPWAFSDYNTEHPDKAVPNPISSLSYYKHVQGLLEKEKPERIAFFAQRHFEQCMVKLADQAMKITGSRDIVAAGGVMLNVKANALIRDELNPDSVQVFPDSADSGLSVGAAMEALHVMGAVREPIKLGSPYLGHEWGQDDLDRALQQAQAAHPITVRKVSTEDLADTIAQGLVVGSFQGRLEFGPRALGNRSVIADPRHAKTKDRINAILKGREWFVPFAPMMLEEDAHLYWEGISDYRFMTFAVQASDYAKQNVPAVVHLDGSMRPQVLTEPENPWVVALLRAFKAKTGIGLLLNTSFNRHGLPIVASPEDAIEHLTQGWVDALAIGPYLVTLNQPASAREGTGDA